MSFFILSLVRGGLCDDADSLPRQVGHVALVDDAFPQGSAGDGLNLVAGKRSSGFFPGDAFRDVNDDSESMVHSILFQRPPPSA
jgi:hypothetical protein